jgi:transcriptional regulator with XRE-family HTH domain
LALASVIRERRAELGLTQEEVGDLHRNTVGEIERARLNPTVTQLDRIAAGLRTSGSSLLEAAEARRESRDRQTPGA